MSFESPLYLDYAATTPMSARVAARVGDVAQSAYANPSSNHIAGRASAAIVARAAEQVAGLLGVAAETLVWTSGATEANNLAIFGIARQRAHRGKHLITMRTEHKAVVDAFRQLEKQDFEVTWLAPDATGLLSVSELQAAIRDDTQLVSVMHVNNETGCVQDLAAIGELCRDRGVLFHVDGAQGAGKVLVDLAELPVDTYALSGHKFYGPKGIGALYVASGVVIEPLLFGGGQQQRRRPGTLATELIAGIGEAADEARQCLEDDRQHCAKLRQQLWQGLQAVGGTYLNGPTAGGYPGILNVGIDDIEGESLLLALEPLCVATGSACNSQSQEPSYVLRALGRSDKEAQSAIRFSFGRFTTEQDIERAIMLYRNAVERLRRIAVVTNGVSQ